MILAIVLFIGTAAGLKANSFDALQDGSPEKLFVDGDNVSFVLNATDNQDYNITLVDSNGTNVVLDQPMNLVSNDGFWVYRYNYSFSSPEGGNWRAFVNMTINKESTLTSTNFHVATDEPNFIDVDHPSQIDVGRDFNVRADISDAQNDFQNVTFDIDSGPTYTMTGGSLGNYSSRFSLTTNFSTTGRRDYTITAVDQNNNQVTKTGSFRVEEGYTDSTSIGVTVTYSCSSELVDFWPPGNGTIFYGQLSYITERIKNTGSLKANFTVDYLNVTREGANEWDRGEPVGPVVKTYPGANFTNVSEQDEVVYNEPFSSSNATGGWYTARTGFTTNCYNHQSNSVDSFQQEAFATFQIVNATGGVSDKGNQTTNQTVESNVSEYDDETSNQTITRDSNRTGDEGNPVEGNSPEAGQTPVPEPEPEPDPIPMLSLDIEPEKSNYQAMRGQYISVNLSLTNEGNTALNDLTIAPQITKFRADWNASNAKVASLAVNQTVTREVLIRPGPNTAADIYVVPVVGSNPENELDVDYFTVEVSDQRAFNAELSILEAPRSVNLVQNTTTPLPVLLENTGTMNLTDVRARLQNSDSCGTATIQGIDSLQVNQTASMNITFQTADVSEECNSTLIVSTEEGAFAFADIGMTVRPRQGLIPQEYRVPFIATAWTALLAAFAIIRRRYGFDSGLLKAPFVLLVMGETLIVVYLIVDYYGLVAASFLPF